jgi:uncharacterized protein YprB with RNaseH-like and TPR domain
LSSLREKLGRLSTGGLVGLAPARAQPRLERAEFLPPTATVHGPVQFIERAHGPHFAQGRVAVGAARIARPNTVASLALDFSLAGVDPSRMLLVDTETTGLQQGTGTLPFVVGLGWFEGESLVLRQLFLGRPGQEAPLLRMLAERLEASSLLVTFNGKSFDWPLLRTRFVLNRIPVPAALPHLDLLHCARRVFKRRLGATRLQDLELAVLGFRREGDIDGAEIPAVYFEWLRGGTSAQVERVLEHNAQDLISMAAVLAELCRRFEDIAPEDAAEDCFSLARVADRCGESERAERFARIAVERATAPQVAFDGLVFLARWAARRRKWNSAAVFLARALALPGLGSESLTQAHLALARLAEHRLKDLSRALHHARLGSRAEPAMASARRIGRLSRRMEALRPQQLLLSAAPGSAALK